MMGSRRLAMAIWGALMIGLVPVSAMAQDAPRSVTFDEELLQGTNWHLSEVADEDGALVEVGTDVEATLLLEGGEANGTGGCNDFFTSYELDEYIIRFGEEIGRTQALCDGQPQAVEDLYLAALPGVVAWSIADGSLQMFDGDSEMPSLVFDDGTFPIAVSEYFAITIQLEDQADAIAALTQQVENLESGSATNGTDEPATTKPRAPRTQGQVQRQFAELGDDPERGLVKWIDRAGDEDAYVVWARRIQCVRQGGEVKEQPSPWVRIARLPANTEQYRPRHDEIVGQIEPQNRRVVGSGALYEVSVSATNDAGRSPRTLVGAYFIAPEYSCR